LGEVGTKPLNIYHNHHLQRKQYKSIEEKWIHTHTRLKGETSFASVLMPEGNPGLLGWYKGTLFYLSLHPSLEGWPWWWGRQRRG
jgi:hypothetical protein